VARPLFPALLIGLLFASCGTPPERDETGRRRQTVLETASDDRDIGAIESERVRHEMGLVENAQLESYVTRVGKRVARGAGGFQYSFQVVDQAAPNAFALPGGHVYVSRGLLTLANSEDELACVLGHEVVHVAARHASARQHVAMNAKNPLMLPGLVLGAVFGESVKKATTEPLRMFSAPYVASYSRDQERAADQQGTRMAARAGYDPAGMAKFLAKLLRYERATFGGSRLPHFMDSHPVTTERFETASAEAGLLHWSRQPGIAATHADFLGHMDGLVIGGRASEGVFFGERFLHPDLDFTIRFPRKWRTVNSQMAVGAVSPDRNVQIFLSSPTKGMDPKAAAQQFIEETRERVRITIKNEKSMKIGKLDAYRIEATGSAGGMALGGQLTWIAHGGRVYRLTAMAPRGVGKKYIGRARNAARSFRPLTAEERASIKERRLRLVKARDGETLNQLAKRSGNEADVTLLAVANDVTSTGRLPGGRVVKIARPEPY
jgi:predicted Zn-dependent protease